MKRVTLLVAASLLTALLLVPAPAAATAPVTVEPCHGPSGSQSHGVYLNGVLLVCAALFTYVGECEGFHGSGVGLYVNGREVFCIH
ncbi:MAG: hypothetical protein ACPGQL_03045 [Thermoplasmatota archaeon]